MNGSKIKYEIASQVLFAYVYPELDTLDRSGIHPAESRLDHVRADANQRPSISHGDLRTSPGRPSANSASRRTLGNAGAATPRNSISARRAMVRVRGRLLCISQTHSSPPVPCRDRSMACIWPHPCLLPNDRDRCLDASAGGRRNRMARLCASSSGKAPRTCARQSIVGSDLGELAFALLFHSRE